jgi:SAM-dependent MidA family methyltransferase
VSTGNPALIEIIRGKIQNHGPQPFAWFMEQALYHPEYGYYSTDRAKIGRRGDYFTNVSVGPLFGQLLALQFDEIRPRLQQSVHFTIVEQGAHHGEFARDVLHFFSQKAADGCGGLQYRIVEPFAKLQDRQSETLRDFRGCVDWRKSLDQLEPFTGIHFSNELLDAFPINLRNKRVAIRGDGFVLDESPGELQQTNQSQLDWMAQIACKLQRGVVLIIDYGFARSEFREIAQVRSGHRQLESPFEQIGEADITAHINWTDIAAAGERNGLEVIGFTDQHHFLTGIISANSDAVSIDKSARALQTLLHPEMLGRSFQVLALAKDVDLAEPLSGFKFARDPRLALGL